MKHLAISTLLLIYMINQLDASENIKGDSTWIETNTGCKVYNPFPVKNETVTWSGECISGFASGKGELSWFKKGTLAQKYTGSMKRGMPSGYGVYDLMNGTIKEGQFDRGTQNGQGKYISKTKDNIVDHYMEGRFVNGELSGIGRELHFDGKGDTTIAYIGSFVNDRWEGQGQLKYYYPDSYILYKGTFKNGELKGDGEKYLFQNNVELRYVKGTFPIEKTEGYVEIRVGLNHYYGQLKKGKREGEGKLITNNVLVYEGEWKSDKFDGFGTRYFINGSIYTGWFRNNVPHGFGMQDWGDGYLYYGEFLDGAFEGLGIVYKDTTVLVSGIWDEGELEYHRDYKIMKEKLSIKFKEEIKALNLTESFLVNN